jgi:predicted PurR-regulated permease PerM
MKEKKSVLAVSITAGMGLLVLIVFVTLLGVQVTAAQQQTMLADVHHAENNNNQSGTGMGDEQQRQNTRTLSEMVTNNQTFNTNWISFVGEVKVTGISVIDTEI